MDAKLWIIYVVSGQLYAPAALSPGTEANGWEAARTSESV